MKIFVSKNLIIMMAFLFGSAMAHAQFDDVYYNPDNGDPYVETSYTGEAATGEAADDYFYYDDDSYEYYEDDYDYYYSSRIRRFHRPFSGFGYYDPAYVDYFYYDPFYTDAYYYPGSTIYISFGAVSYWDYHRWRRWHRWNSWNTYYGCGSWGVNPYHHYYNYNSWCGYSNNQYWDGYYGYNSYSNYYNNYYSSCPLPVGNYHGITHTSINHINSGGTRGTFYGPRISGNTGSSPRGPVDNPGVRQPVYEDRNGVTQTNTSPTPIKDSGIPGRANPPVTTPGGTGQSPNAIPSTRDEVVNGGTDQSPNSIPSTRGTSTPGNVNQIPVDKELKRDPSPDVHGRPVFRPESDRYKPYPNDDVHDRSGGQKPTTDRPAYRPSTPGRQDTPQSRDDYSPKPSTSRPSYTPGERDPKPSYNPSESGRNDRPVYTPPTRNDHAPSYTPPSGNSNSERSNDRPSYSPPSRQQDGGTKPERPSYTPPSRSNDGPSYSPPSRNNSGGSDSGRSSSSPSRSDSSSGNRPSGGHSSGSTSPRGRG